MMTKNKGLAIVALTMLTTMSLANAATGDEAAISTGVTTALETTSTNASTGSVDGVFQIDKVESTTQKTIDATFTKSVSKDGMDIKVMEDNRISSVTPDSLDTKKVKIALNEDIALNSSYNLFLVSGPEGSMTFDLGTELATGSIVNTETTGEQNIVSISFVDTKNIEVTFKKDVAGNAEFKLLREIPTDSITAIDNKVTIMTKDDLSNSKSYTLTIANLKDSEGNDISAEDSIYDFNYTGLETTDTASGATDLNAATGATATGVEVAASQAKELPGTGTKENLLFLASLLLSLFVVLYYRKKIAR
ncbi:MAG: Ig-like domain-containing protein [Candidatus Gracilibacteria bacterium]|nr:Ig-like domain-containing protein [Candidatus Gracilibacteria bacterium]